MDVLCCHKDAEHINCMSYTMDQELLTPQSMPLNALKFKLHLMSVRAD